jgi:hypothetical protein
VSRTATCTFLARPGIDLGRLHEASVLQKTDVRHAAISGSLVGALLGALAGWLLAQYPIENLRIGVGGILLFTAFGAGFGFFASTLVGTSLPNSYLKAVRARARRRPHPRDGRRAAAPRRGSAGVPAGQAPRGGLERRRPGGARFPLGRPRVSLWVRLQPDVFRSSSGPEYRIFVRYAARPAARYAELHGVSNFSFLRGASHPEELVDRAASLGYAALALTDECSLAGIVRAHLAAKDAQLPLVVGSEFTLDDGTRLALYATDRATYGDLAQLITRGRRQARKARTGCRAATSSRWGRAASRCGCRPIRSAPPKRAWATRRAGSPARSRRAQWLAVELFARAGDDARRDALEALARAHGLPCLASGDVHMHVRARRALQDTLTAIRLRTPVAQCGRALFPNGERPPALARAAVGALPAGDARADARARVALRVLARRAALRVSRRGRAAGRDGPRRTCAS